MSYHVIITDSQFPNHLPEQEVLSGLGTITKIDWDTECDLIARISSADALLVQYAPINETVIKCLKQCKVIVRYGIGVDNIDLDAATRKGIAVCNVPDYCIEEVADHTIAMALSALRQIPDVDLRIRAGEWFSTLPKPVFSFSKMSFCLVGFGRIAREVAKRALGLGFKVSAYDPHVELAKFSELKVTALPLDELIANADILSLHIPATDNSLHFIDKKILEKMKRNVLIVNTSRGRLIDSEALASAILSGRIWGAALDVFENEPLPSDSVLRSCPNVLLSSHIAWYSEDSFLKLQKQSAEEIKRVLTGLAPLNLVS